jgi:phytoene dehydrogenase-like protein
MASGTAFQLLYNFPSSGLDGTEINRFVRGGVGGLAAALADAAIEHRAEIRTGHGVDRILVRDGKAAGVRLETGEEIKSHLVISSADPRRTYLGLVGGAELLLKVVRRVKNIRFQGSTSKVNFALSGVPAFEGVFGLEGLKSRVIISPGVEYLERAYDEAKYGRIPAHPPLEIVIPTLLDPTLAPAGSQILSVCVRYTPYQLREGSWDERREELGDLVVKTLAGLASDLRKSIIDRQILTPLDLEREVGLTEGSEYHGQMGLDQLLFMRPIAGYGRYRAPISNLYLCGAGTHPGGGVTGAPGYNAAREIFAEWRG